jgi:UDP-N-acetylmuramoyl-L-alanyl-D-glutamate--2,6-diaminopimelate ligase
VRILKDILYKVEITSVVGDTNLTVYTIAFDSRKVTENTLFVAIKGVDADGHNYIEKSC